MRFAWILVALLSALTASAQLCVQHLASPSYPRLARIAQLEGAVKVVAQVDEAGKLSSVRAFSGPKLLAQSAEENLRQWVLCRDWKSSGHLTVTYIYKLQGEPQYEDGPPTVVFDLPDEVHIMARPYEPQPLGRE